MAACIGEEEGRGLFGADPRNYDQIRPPYPEPIYEFLEATGALFPGAVTLEIGAGSGIATRRLLEAGVDPLTIVEPDPRFAPWLEQIASSSKARIERIEAPFEEADLPPAGYDLVAAATSFHWIQPEVGLGKVATVLKPGGHAALWWHVFGADHDDPYHLATRAILEPLASSPSSPPDAVPFGLDIQARLEDFERTGQFEIPEFMDHRWPLVLGTEQVGALYATFSTISRLPEEQRKALLSQLMEIAERDFGGRVVRNMVSAAYVARRKPDGFDASAIR